MALTWGSLTSFWRQRPLLTKIAMTVWLLCALAVLALFVAVAVMIVVGESESSAPSHVPERLDR